MPLEGCFHSDEYARIVASSPHMSGTTFGVALRLATARRRLRARPTTSSTPGGCKSTIAPSLDSLWATPGVDRALSTLDAAHRLTQRRPCACPKASSTPQACATTVSLLRLAVARRSDHHLTCSISRRVSSRPTLLSFVTRIAVNACEPRRQLRNVVNNVHDDNAKRNSLTRNGSYPGFCRHRGPHLPVSHSTTRSLAGHPRLTYRVSRVP